MKKTFLIILFIFVAMQFIQVEHINKTANPTLEINGPQEIKEILKRACYDCHSNEVNLPWYSNIAPISFMIYKNVTSGRETLNFSIWEEYSSEDKQKKLKEIFRTVYAAMPPPSYMYMHKDANLSTSDRKIVRDWIGYSK